MFCCTIVVLQGSSHQRIETCFRLHFRVYWSEARSPCFPRLQRLARRAPCPRTRQASGSGPSPSSPPRATSSRRAASVSLQDTYPTIDSRSEVYQFNKDGQVKLHFESAIHALHLVPSQPAIEHLYSRRLHGRRASRSQRPCSARSRQQCGGRSRRRSRLRLQVRRYSYSRFSILAAPFWLFHFGCTIVSESVFALVALSESHSPCVCRWQCSRSKGWRTP